DNPAFQEGAPFYEAAMEAITSVDAENPGVQPRPYPGVQVVGIPEFISLGTTVSEYIASAIAGSTSVQQARGAAQVAAQEVGDKYKNKSVRLGARWPARVRGPPGPATSASEGPSVTTTQHAYRPGPVRDRHRASVAARDRRPGALRRWSVRAPLLPALVFTILFTPLPFAIG